MRGPQDIVWARKVSRPDLNSAHFALLNMVPPISRHALPFLLVLHCISYHLAASAAVWPQMGYDNTHRGVSPYNGPVTSSPVQALSYTAGNTVTSPTIASDGTVYFGSADYSMYAISGTTGALVWKYTTGGSITACGTIAPTDNSINFGSDDGYFYKLNTAGVLMWRLSIGYVASTGAAATIDSSGNIYVGGGSYLYVIPPSGTTYTYRYSASSNIVCAPALASDGSVVFSDTNAYLYRYSSTGTKWTGTPYLFNSHTILGPGSWSSPTIAPSGVIYIGDEYGEIIAITWTSSTTAPTSSVVTSVPSCYSITSQPALDASGNLYFGCWDSSNGYEYKYTSGGTQVWSDYLYASVSDNTVMGADGTWYIGSPYGYFYAGVPGSATGALRFSYTVSAAAGVTSSAAIAADGKIWVGTGSTLIALSDPTPSSTPTVTPTVSMTKSVSPSPTVTPTYTPSTSVTKTTSSTASPSPSSAPQWLQPGNDNYHTGRTKYQGPITSSVALKLSYTATSGVTLSSPTIGRDGTVYVGGSDGKLYAINGGSAAVSWTFTTAGAISAAPTIATTDSTLNFGSNDGNFYKVSASGTQVWSLAISYAGMAAAAVSSTGVIYVCGGANLYFLPSAGGSITFQFAINGGCVYSAPLIAADGSILVVSTTGYLYRYTAAGAAFSGSPTQFNTQSSPYVGSMSSVSYDAVTSNFYVGDNFGTMRGIAWATTPSTSTVTSPSSCYQMTSVPAIGSDGSIYFGCASSADGRVFAMTSAWATSWTYSTSSNVSATPILGADGTVYIGAGNTYMYAFAKATGAVLWSYKLSSAVTGSAAIDSYGVLWFTNGNVLYGLSDPWSPSPTPTVTPTGSTSPSSTITSTTTFTPTVTPTFTKSSTNTVTVTPSSTQTGTSTFTSSSTFTPSPTFTRSATFTASPTYTTSSTFTPTFTATPTPTYTASATFTSTATPTPTSTYTTSSTLTPTVTPSPTSTYTGSATFTSTATPTPTSTYTTSSTFSPSPSPTPTGTYTPSSTFSATSTKSASPTVTSTYTPSYSVTPSLSTTPGVTITSTPSVTPTISVTGTVTPSPTFTSSPTPTFTASATYSGTATATATITSTESSTFTPTSSTTRTTTTTYTSTGSPTTSPSASITITVTQTATDSVTPTVTITVTSTCSPSPSSTVTITASVSSTDTVTPTATDSASPSTTGTVTVTRTSSQSATESRTVTRTQSATDTPTSTDSPTSTPSSTDTPTTTATVTITATSSSTVTGTVTASITPTPSTSPSDGSSLTRTPSVTSTISVTASDTPTPSVTPSPSTTSTPTPSYTVTVTVTRSQSRTRSASDSSSSSASETATDTASSSSSVTQTGTVTATITPTQSMSLSSTSSRSLSPSPTISTTPTASRSWSMSASPTFSVTPTPSLSADASTSSTPTITPSVSVSPSSSVSESASTSISITPSASTSSASFPSATPSTSVSASATSSLSLSSSSSPSPLVSPSPPSTSSPLPSLSATPSPSPTGSESSVNDSPSNSPQPVPNIDCVVSPSWSSWSACTTNSTCATDGLQIRYRRIVVFQSGYGAPCPPPSDLQQVTQCTVEPPFANCTSNVCATTGTCGVNTTCGLCGESKPCNISSDSKNLASTSLYVQNSVVLMGVDPLVFSADNIIAAFKTTIVYHVAIWGFGGITSADVSILSVGDAVGSTACSVLILNGPPITVTTGSSINFVVKAINITNAVQLSQALSTNLPALARELQQQLLPLAPGLCGVDVPSHIAPIVAANTQPLVGPSASPSPSSSSGSMQFSLIYVVAAGVGGIVLTAVAGLLLWKYRRDRKHLRRRLSFAPGLDNSKLAKVLRGAVAENKMDSGGLNNRRLRNSFVGDAVIRRQSPLLRTSMEVEMGTLNPLNSRKTSSISNGDGDVTDGDMPHTIPAVAHTPKPVPTPVPVRPQDKHLAVLGLYTGTGLRSQVYGATSRGMASKPRQGRRSIVESDDAEITVDMAPDGDGDANGDDPSLFSPQSRLQQKKLRSGFGPSRVVSKRSVL